MGEEVECSEEYSLLYEMREMLSQEWVGFLADKGGDRLSRIRSGAPATGELTKLIHEVQGKMCGEKFFKMHNFINDFQDFPGVLPMEDALLKLSIHLETSPPETNEAKFYVQRVVWLETFCHITGILVGQMDVILGFLNGRKSKAVLRKTKDLLANCDDESVDEEAVAAESCVTKVHKMMSLRALIGYCTIL